MIRIEVGEDGRIKSRRRVPDAIAPPDIDAVFAVALGGPWAGESHATDHATTYMESAATRHATQGTVPPTGHGASHPPK